MAATRQRRPELDPGYELRSSAIPEDGRHSGSDRPYATRIWVAILGHPEDGRHLVEVS